MFLTAKPMKVFLKIRLLTLNTYGMSKAAAEKIIIDSKLNYAIIRTSWLYSSFGHNFFKSIITKINQKEDLKIVDDQIGSPTYAKDLAKFILHTLEKMINSKEFREIFTTLMKGRHLSTILQ